MSFKPTPLNNKIYAHICNKSIAGFRIFEDGRDVRYFLTAADYYRNPKPLTRLSTALKTRTYVPTPLLAPTEHVRIFAYCIMPTHYHILLSSETNTALARYIGIIENSYTRYFNLRHNRLGPLWQSRYKKSLVTNNPQLQHVMRYIHLNPTTSELCENPEDWKYSSYTSFLTEAVWLRSIPEISIKSIETFKQFTTNNLAYQRTLHKLKKHTKLDK